jgi:mannitol-1-phosphate/altronate dehydrogenase
MRAQPAVEVIGSIVGYVHAARGRDDLMAALVTAPSTAILSLTITEAGYGEAGP